MEGIVRTVCDNPLVAVVACFAALLIVYFLFKSLIKLALILLIVAVVIGGYVYYKHPESRPADFKDAVEKAMTGAGKAVDQGKETYEKGKEIYQKGRELVDKGKVVLDTGIDKGKEAVAKGSDTAGEIGKVLRGDNEEGNRRNP
jgi:hypothetical protein